MLDLTFGEQVKIILSRKGMTIKELAEMIEERTGKRCPGRILRSALEEIIPGAGHAYDRRDS